MSLQKLIKEVKLELDEANNLSNKGQESIARSCLKYARDRIDKYLSEYKQGK